MFSALLQKKLWHERCMGGVASPSSAGNSIWLYLQHTLPPALGAWQCGDTRGLPLQERTVLCVVLLQGVFPQRGARACLCWVFQRFLCVELANMGMRFGSGRTGRVAQDCVRKLNCLLTAGREGVLQLSLEPLGLALVVRRLWPARSRVVEVPHTLLSCS